MEQKNVIVADNYYSLHKNPRETYKPLLITVQQGAK